MLVREQQWGTRNLAASWRACRRTVLARTGWFRSSWLHHRMPRVREMDWWCAPGSAEFGSTINLGHYRKEALLDEYASSGTRRERQKAWARTAINCWRATACGCDFGFGKTATRTKYGSPLGASGLQFSPALRVRPAKIGRPVRRCNRCTSSILAWPIRRRCWLEWREKVTGRRASSSIRRETARGSTSPAGSAARSSRYSPVRIGRCPVFRR